MRHQLGEGATASAGFIGERFDGLLGAEKAEPRTLPELPFTGERMVPGKSEAGLFLEHEARYIFAGELVRDKSVLDVACGAGIGTHYLLTRGARSCVGLDIDAPSVAFARAAYRGCEFAECDAANLCVADSSMDVVVSFETIEHLRDYGKFLSECRRVLKPGGILICSTPNRTISRWATDNPFHVREFTVTEFRDMLETIFTNVELFGQKNTNQLLYAGQRILSRVLHAIRLMNVAKGVLGRKAASPLIRVTFDGASAGPEQEIERFRDSPLVQPKYVIAVARRSL